MREHRKTVTTLKTIRFSKTCFYVICTGNTRFMATAPPPRDGGKHVRVRGVEGAVEDGLRVPGLRAELRVLVANVRHLRWLARAHTSGKRYVRNPPAAVFVSSEALRKTALTLQWTGLSSEALAPLQQSPTV